MYRQLLKVCPSTITNEDKKLIRKAFNFSAEAHKDMKRISGEPYVYHPISVATIAAKEIGLGTKSIVASLLHDIIEDTDYTYEDIKIMFGDNIAKIVDGLTKISEFVDASISSELLQAENFKKVLLTLSDDIRVILIKIADRLHNMRTLESLSAEKRIKVSSETSYLYAPLAYRLGLYSIKNEMEDLVLKYTEPDIYKTISQKLLQAEKDRKKQISNFIRPIQIEFEKIGMNFEILSRLKSINSVWDKMKKKQIPFEEIYDFFAVRIIIDTRPENEKSDCWKAYSTITDIYRPKPDRLRDWLSIPKANGYEALHATVMSDIGRWVEIQIRTRRMDEIAEKGYAAHWKYKDSFNSGESTLDLWLDKIRETLNDPDSDILSFLDDFKMNLFSDEIYVFTPKGEMKILPKNSTALDFAYSIHSEIGNKCIGAKVNSKLMPLSHTLKNGDQIEIISSNKQTPQNEWLEYVSTARAKMQIKRRLKKLRNKMIKDGKQLLSELFSNINVDYSEKNIALLQKHFNYNYRNDLYYDVSNKVITVKEIKSSPLGKFNWLQYFAKPFIKVIQQEKKIKKHHPKTDNKKIIIYDTKLNILSVTLSDCCKPIPQDEIIAFLHSNRIYVHRTSCQSAITQSSTYGHKITKVKWNPDINMLFFAEIKIGGVDRIGIIRDCSEVLSEQMNTNIRSFHINADNEIFEGEIKLFLSNTEHLKEIIQQIKNIDGVKKVFRI